ncbi:hypothetical protein [Enterobacter sp. R1(2018)]|uniref:hypothetical protein n=1 Tax=Enterobacter sp. R1(2018) TaxID=2447891 RepID=UPI000EB03CEF|nr:hypothetical protein [Enterobacter sp. R1(2018)]RKQ39420.1 hypothetical protein D8M09_12400 [Enterobacter sp. R1(2018)]
MKKYLPVLLSASLMIISAASYGEAIEYSGNDMIPHGIATFTGSSDKVSSSGWKITDLEEMKDTLKKAIAKQEDMIRKADDQSRKISDLNNKISQLESKSSAQDSKIDGLQRSLDDMKRSNDSLSNQVKDLSSKMK